MATIISSSAARRAGGGAASESIKDRLRNLFRRYPAGPERLAAIHDLLQRGAHILSAEQRHYFAARLEDTAAVSDEDEFVARTLAAAKYHRAIRADTLYQEEELARRRMYEEHPTYRELNRLFACEIDADAVYLHVAVNKTTSAVAKRRLVVDGLRKLAVIVCAAPGVGTVIARSWIVAEYRSLVERIGFTVCDIETDSTGTTVGRAVMSRDDLLRRYSGTRCDERLVEKT